MHHITLRGCGDEHIDEASARDLYFLDDVGFWQRRDQRIRDVSRRLAQRLGQLHRQVAGIVPMRRKLGTFDKNGRAGLVGRDLVQSLREQIGQMGFEIQDSGHEAVPFERRGL
jgi:hypothetical protein